MQLSLALVVIMVLVLGAVFVNGWTDAPNAIATAVSTRVLAPRTAMVMAVVMNFLGVLTMSFISREVAETVSHMVRFDAGTVMEAQVTLAAALLAIVLWATAAWYFGIPTSESHALIAGLTGAAVALGGLDAVSRAEWAKVLIGLMMSTGMGFGLGFVIARAIERLCARAPRKGADRVFTVGSALAAAANAFLHGAQDGQKFMAVFMLALYLGGLTDKTATGAFDIPVWVMVVCSVTMGLGTSMGGYRIIKAVGFDMVRLKRYQGFAADLAAAVCLLVSSIFGLPVSTTHTKTTAIMGVGAARRRSLVNWNIASEMALAWVLTFPGCALAGFLMAKLFLLIF